jgi:hypothetical protein
MFARALQACSQLQQPSFIEAQRSFQGGQLGSVANLQFLRSVIGIGMRKPLKTAATARSTFASKCSMPQICNTSTIFATRRREPDKGPRKPSARPPSQGWRRPYSLAFSGPSSPSRAFRRASRAPPGSTIAAWQTR